jgi:hypothetical protein
MGLTLCVPNASLSLAEQPIYFQFAFALDRIKALFAQHPEWRDTQPYKAVVESDTQALAVDGKPLRVKEPKVEFIDDGKGKPVGIN